MAKTIARDEVHKGYVDFDKNEARNVRAQNLGADIAGPVNGLWFYRSDTNKFRGYVNGAWDDFAMMGDVTAAGISSTLVDAKGDLIVGTADNTVARKAAGANGTTLFADSAQGDGLNWRAITSADLSDFAEGVADTVGAMVTGNTETGLTVVYDDADNTLDLVVTDAPLLQGQNGAYYLARGNLTGSDSPATTAFTATDRLLGRDTAGAGAGEEISVGGGIEFTGTGGLQSSAFTGDVTKTAGGTALTVANDAITNAKAANMAANTLKGNNTGGSADPADLTVAQVKTLLAIVPGDVSGFDTQVRTNRLDQMATPTASVGLGSQKIINLADGTVATDAATFGQLNAVVQGQTWKAPVRLATTVNDALTGLAARDGITPVAGDRVLVKAQTAGAANGIYVAAAGAWTRATDADIAAELNNATVLVLNGTVHQGDIFTQTATVVTLGTTVQTWVQSGEGNAVYTADGTTIELVGNSFRISATAAGNGLSGGGGSALAVNVGTGLEISADAVRIAAAAAGNGLVGGAGSALAVGAGTGITVGADTVGITAAGVTATELAASVAGNGLVGGAGTALAVGAGTGISVAADSVAIDTAVVTRKSSGTLGDGSATSFVLTHSLNSRAVQVTVYLNSGTYDEVDVEVQHTSVNTVTVIFTGVVPTAAQYGWIVQG